MTERKKTPIVLYTISLAIVGLTLASALLLRSDEKKTQASLLSQSDVVESAPSPTQKPLPKSHALSLPLYEKQTFNNCGPATLSMALAYFGNNIGQHELGRKMRPNQNPQGINDDKSVFADEFVKYAKQYGFEALHRPNGTIDLLRQLTAEDIPVVVRTWLHPNEDIGHFRIIRGYDDESQTFLQDDSYEGPNLRYDYQTFEKMWQPFNYGYILIYPKEKENVVRSILGEEMNEQTAWMNALSRANNELNQTPVDEYSQFNVATANYFLGKPQETIGAYEKTAATLPPRMLWYQLEPIKAYLETGNYDKVFSLTEEILNSNNRGYSELYYFRGVAFQKQGRVGEAREQYELAVLYNQNYQAAKDALNAL